MRSLITGGAGFVGSHLTEHLLQFGDEVVVLDDLSTGRLENLAHAGEDPRLDIVVGSVLETDLVDRLVAGVDRVFHLAAAVGVRMILDEPLASLRTNIYGTENVLESAVRHDRPVLLVSTSEIYGKNTADRLTEDADRILGSPQTLRWSYAAAKGIDEAFATAHAVQDGLDVVIVRLFNTVGPRQSGQYGMVIPRFVGNALAGRPLEIHGDGTQTRCFCHVQDTIRALSGLMDARGISGEIYNVGSTERITINDLAKRVLTMTGSSSSVVPVPYDEVYGQGIEDMLHRQPSIGKIGEAIGWEPTRDLEEILRDVIGHARSAPAFAAAED